MTEADLPKLVWLLAALVEDLAELVVPTIGRRQANDVKGRVETIKATISENLL